jgi:hypothetical protein
LGLGLDRGAWAGRWSAARAACPDCWVGMGTGGGGDGLLQYSVSVEIMLAGGRLEELIPSEPCLACQSAISFPKILAWPGTQWMSAWVKVVRVRRFSITSDTDSEW